MRTILTFFLSVCFLPVVAQYALHSSFDSLNTIRIHTNQKGMKVLGTWGVANIIEGGIGIATAKNNEWKSFHEMNLAWGAVNTGIAIAGYFGARKELDKKVTCSQALQNYESYKRLYLINAGLDIVYTGAGLVCIEHAKNTTLNKDTWNGFGKSLVIQGAFLFVFDNIMFASHQKRNTQWYKLLQGVCLSGNGIGMNYQF
ncbi:MAG: hypothetical protein H0X33_08415 [Taibaiella sp.]|nr:hypothetical protein [Taibaiella sp.]